MAGVFFANLETEYKFFTEPFVTKLSTSQHL